MQRTPEAFELRVALKCGAHAQQSRVKLPLTQPDAASSCKCLHFCSALLLSCDYCKNVCTFLVITLVRRQGRQTRCGALLLLLLLLLLLAQAGRTARAAAVM